MGSISRRSFIGGVAAAAAPPAFVRSPARAAQFTIKCGATLALEHPLSVRGRQMWNAVERESDGRISVQYFPNDQLGSEVGQLTQLRVGALQFFHCPPGISAAIVPAADIADLGFAFRDEDEAFRSMDGPLGEYIRKEFAAKGMYALATVWQSGMREVTSSSHPIRTVEDFRGFKIRTAPSKISVDLFKTLGASPTPMAFIELYTALQTRVVDGATNPLVTVQASRYFEVQKYLSLTNDSWSCMWWLANGDFWKSLPSDLQAVIERNNKRFALLERRDTKIVNASVGDKLAREGMIVNQTDPAVFRAELGPYYAYWKDAFGPTQWSLLQNSVSGKLA